LNIEGLDLNFAKPVRNKFTDPARGELYEPLAVIPSFDVSISNGLVVHKMAQRII
jgi:hypothetical protein